MEILLKAREAKQIVKNQKLEGTYVPKEVVSKRKGKPEPLAQCLPLHEIGVGWILWVISWTKNSVFDVSKIIII